MAIKLVNLVFFPIFLLIVAFISGCSTVPQCVPCDCPDCPTKLEVCQSCSYPEMGCVEVSEVNSLLNLTNNLIKIYNENSGEEQIGELPYYEKVGEVGE